MNKAMYFHLLIVWLAVLLSANGTPLEPNAENACEFIRNVAKFEDEENDWWEKSKNLANSILETQIRYKQSYRSCTQQVASLQNLKNRGNDLSASSPWAQRIEYLNASSQEYQGGPCADGEPYSYIYSRDIKDMKADIRELSQSVKDQNEYHNFVAQVDTNVDTIRNVLSEFSIPTLKYLTRFPLTKCTLPN
ncbi:uncharacterized protein LOC122626622 [Drosophila teissieri]|uniref:uncharacterized protein LOC122626622 n=1 Tax=Drosophila teissieri TaxID=7243 RepID=UPI001CB9EC42|nr:uncharacterized protein LOC122626622 [Drosophila teissieri]XP_043662880.1 uncharacterized protein LOC122626622 [Drosophila teissieri]